MLPKILIYLSLFSLLLFGCKQSSEPIDKDKVRITRVCDLFMESFKEGRYLNAFDLFRKNTILSTGSIDTLQATVEEQIKSYFPPYGNMRSYTFIAEKKIKDFLFRRFYILQFDHYFLKFEFTAYKTANGWKLTGLTYNEEITDLLTD